METGELTIPDYPPAVGIDGERTGLSRLERAWTRIPADDYEQAVARTPELSEAAAGTCTHLQRLMVECDTLIDVGCGTGCLYPQLLLPGRAIIGVDVSDLFLARVRARNALDAELYLLKGDARRLDELLTEQAEFLPPDLRDRRKILACTMNTLGVVSRHSRRKIVCEIVRVAREGGGTIVLGTFEAAQFAVKAESIYCGSPQLFGPIDPKRHLDVIRSELRAPLFQSHWFSDVELLELLVDAGLRLRSLDFEQIGIGRLLVAEVDP